MFFLYGQLGDNLHYATMQIHTFFDKCGDKNIKGMVERTSRNWLP